MSTGNKIILGVGIGTAGLIALFMIVNFVVAPAGLVEEPEPVADVSVTDQKKRLGWVEGAHQPVIEVNDETFATAVLASDRPVLVDFWATWCGPCVEMAPVIEEFAQQYSGTFRVTRLDVDQNPQTTREYRVDALPTLVMFYEGKEVDRIEGLTSLDELGEEVEKFLDQHAQQPES